MRLSLHCIDSTGYWMMPGEKRVDHPFTMAIRGAPLRLTTYVGDGSKDGIHFVARQRLTPYFHTELDEFRCRTEAYHYTISDADQQELVSWHWHPDSRPDTHLHVAHWNKRSHIPAGRITFESIVRFIIEEMRVEPAKDDWDDRLAEQEAKHLKYRSWS